VGQYVSHGNLLTLRDYELEARKVLDPSIWAYFFGGAGDEVTLKANALDWQQIELRPRVLRSMTGGHTEMRLFGKTYPSPLLLAPMAYQLLAHPHAESGMAMAAASQGVGMVLSCQSSQTLEVVAKHSVSEFNRGPLWFQLYWQPDPAINASLLQRAEQAGYEAIVLTVDAPVQGVRDSEIRLRFKLPAHVRAANLPNEQTHLNPPKGVFDHWMPQAPNWKDIERLCQQTSLPVLLKGITHPDDAKISIDKGARGLIVSNHGGRVLDTMPSTASILPEIVKVVANQVPVLVDGGLRRGTDVFKALALGATAVLLGRPALQGLTCGGAQGVAHVLRLFCDEFESTMALCGCPHLCDIDLSNLDTKF
jgi:4-hydroxymandelate oxidase